MSPGGGTIPRRAGRLASGRVPTSSVSGRTVLPRERPSGWSDPSETREAPASRPPVSRGGRTITWPESQSGTGCRLALVSSQDHGQRGAVLVTSSPGRQTEPWPGRTSPLRPTRDQRAAVGSRHGPTPANGVQAADLHSRRQRGVADDVKIDPQARRFEPDRGSDTAGRRPTGVPGLGRRARRPAVAAPQVPAPRHRRDVTTTSCRRAPCHRRCPGRAARPSRIRVPEPPAGGHSALLGRRPPPGSPTAVRGGVRWRSCL